MWKIITGDVRRECKQLEECSFDAVLCDSPYGLSFMGRRWDYDVPSAMLWSEVLRVVKPGAHLINFSSTRTYHRMVVNLEDAGFEIRDMLSWLYGQGWPKGILDIGKSFDDAAGVERPTTGSKVYADGHVQRSTKTIGYGGCDPTADKRLQSEPVTEQAKRWDGHGTVLKPACEPAVLARKPVEGTITENAERHGTGGLAIDVSRIGTEGGTAKPSDFERAPSTGIYGNGINSKGAFQIVDIGKGRFPTNVIVDEEAASLIDAQSGERPGGGTVNTTKQGFASKRSMFHTEGEGRSEGVPFAGYDDSGGASRYYKTIRWAEDDLALLRFFYTQKAARSEREAGLEDRPLVSNGQKYGTLQNTPNPPQRNDHPTVKPIELMRYLARLILPPRTNRPRRILVPFSGSGSEMIGALQAGWDEVVGIERDPHYVELATSRITRGGVFSRLAQPKKRKRISR